MKNEHLFVNKICCTRRVLNIHLTFILENCYNIKKTIPTILQVEYSIDEGVICLSLYILNIQHPVQSGFYNQYNLTLKPLHLPYTFIFIIRVSISFS